MTWTLKIGQFVGYPTCSVGWLFGHISNLWTDQPSGDAYARVYWTAESAIRDDGTYAELPVHRLQKLFKEPYHVTPDDIVQATFCPAEDCNRYAHEPDGGCKGGAA